MENKCLCCGKITSHRENPAELIWGHILCRDCAEDIFYELKKIYRTMPEEKFLEIRNNIVEDCKRRFPIEVTRVVVATANSKFYGTTDVERENIEEIVPQIKGNIRSYNVSNGAEESSIMFDNIGGKIKSVAGLLTAIGIIVSIIIGVVLMVTDESLVLPGIIVATAGSFVSWISSFLLYGFGQLVENSDKIVKLLKNK